jgi:hypothetical protein
MRGTPKRRRVERLLQDPVWAQRSTNWIARQARVSWAFADQVREQLGGRPGHVETQSGRRVRSHRKRRNFRHAQI